MTHLAAGSSVSLFIRYVKDFLCLFAHFASGTLSLPITQRQRPLALPSARPLD
jgi:hypothetical protein